MLGFRHGLSFWLVYTGFLRNIVAYMYVCMYIYIYIYIRGLAWGYPKATVCFSSNSASVRFLLTIFLLL